MQAHRLPPDDPHHPSVTVSLPERSLCRVMLKNGIWLLGILTWLFGVIDRGYIVLTDGMAVPVHLAQLFAAVALLMGWLVLKPETSPRSSQKVAFQDCSASLPLHQPTYLDAIRGRMLELQSYHLMGREYVLPFPFLCQIYHLLNLKHLESIHSFSLNNLKVLTVSDFQPTAIGGILRFETILDSPLNILRLWRQKAVEVELTLHTPFTVELQVPVHNEKRINVLFNVLPLSQKEHRFFVDIYSNLPWPKPLLRFFLEFATSLTLLEDLPYLRKLTSRKQQSLIRPSATSGREQESSDTMQLYHRYVNLYGSMVSLPTEHQDQVSPEVEGKELAL